MVKKLVLGALTLKNNLILAPMAGITDLPMRLIAREYGASLCFTEMVSAHGLVRNGKKTLELLRSTSEDRPLGIQLFGDDPRLLAEGARAIEEYGVTPDILVTAKGLSGGIYPITATVYREHLNRFAPDFAPG